MSTHKIQLIAGTYCKFSTKDEYYDTLEKAKELSIGVSYVDSANYVYWDGSYMHFGTLECMDDGGFTISTTEFLARMEGTWEDKQLDAVSKCIDFMERRCAKKIKSAIDDNHKDYPEQLTLPQAIAKLEADGWEKKDGELINTSKDYYLTQAYTKEWRAYFYSKATNLSVDDLENWKSNFEQAIEACNTLNNATNG